MLNKKNVTWTMYFPCPPENWYISVYIVPNIFSPNLMIIITGTFRNTSNPLKQYEITLFTRCSLAYYSVYESNGSHYADDTWTLNACHGHNFYCRDLKFSDIVPNTITIVKIKINVQKLTKFHACIPQDDWIEILTEWHDGPCGTEKFYSKALGINSANGNKSIMRNRASIIYRKCNAQLRKWIWLIDWSINQNGLIDSSFLILQHYLRLCYLFVLCT